MNPSNTLFIDKLKQLTIYIRKIIIWIALGIIIALSLNLLSSWLFNTHLSILSNLSLWSSIGLLLLTAYALTNAFKQIPPIIGQLVSWLTIGMLVILTINILASWLFKSSSILLSESITWMHSANFLLATAYTLNRNNHVRVDIFYAKMSAKTRALVDLLGTLLLLIPTSAFILWSSWSYVLLSWRIGETSAEAGGIPATYLLKGFLIIMPVLLILEAINQIALQLKILSSPSSSNDDNSNIANPKPGETSWNG